MLEVVIMVMSKIFFSSHLFYSFRDRPVLYAFDLKELKIIDNLFIIINIKTSSKSIKKTVFNNFHFRTAVQHLSNQKNSPFSKKKKKITNILMNWISIKCKEKMKIFPY